MSEDSPGPVEDDVPIEELEKSEIVEVGISEDAVEMEMEEID